MLDLPTHVFIVYNTRLVSGNFDLNPKVFLNLLMFLINYCALWGTGIHELGVSLSSAARLSIELLMSPFDFGGTILLDYLIKQKRSNKFNM